MLIVFIGISTTLPMSLWTHCRQRMFSRIIIFLIFLNILNILISFIRSIDEEVPKGVPTLEPDI